MEDHTISISGLIQAYILTHLLLYSIDIPASNVPWQALHTKARQTTFIVSLALSPGSLPTRRKSNEEGSLVDFIT